VTFLRACTVILLVGCGNTTGTEPVRPAPALAAPGQAPAEAETRCLPVIAKECHCSYTCGTGVRDGDHWMVTHEVWKDPLKARVEQYCEGQPCTPVFAGEIVCDSICNAMPVDTTCHFDASGVCRGAR
jgi:hypothetical protein